MGGYDLVHYDDLAYVASAHQERKCFNIRSFILYINIEIDINIIDNISTSFEVKTQFLSKCIEIKYTFCDYKLI